MFVSVWDTTKWGGGGTAPVIQYIEMYTILSMIPFSLLACGGTAPSYACSFMYNWVKEYKL